MHSAPPLSNIGLDRIGPRKVGAGKQCRLIRTSLSPSGIAGTSYPEDMPSFAADALEAGFDGSALRRLAGLVKPTSWDVDNLFVAAIDEIGVIEVRNREEAVFRLAKVVAENILDGSMDAFEGAHRLSRYAMEAGYPDGLAEFDQLADEPRWGESARSQDLIRADIVAAAQKLLACFPI